MGEGGIHKVKNGRNTFFWHDVWFGDSLLKNHYENLFRIFTNCFLEGELQISLGDPSVT